MDELTTLEPLLKNLTVTGLLAASLWMERKEKKEERVYYRSLLNGSIATMMAILEEIAPDTVERVQKRRRGGGDGGSGSL